MNKHVFRNWSETRSSGLQRVMIKPGERHATCSNCGAHAKRTTGGRFLYWTSTKNPDGSSTATWSVKSPECRAEPQAT